MTNLHYFGEHAIRLQRNETEVSAQFDCQYHYHNYIRRMNYLYLNWQAKYLDTIYLRKLAIEMHS